MRLPTAVAVGPAGDVFVLDGAHNRVLVFGATGALHGVLAKFGALELDQPVGLRIAADGRLWIADSGQGRIVVAEPDGELVEVLELPPPEGHAHADPTDVAVLREGAFVWVVENDQHRVVGFDRATGTWSIVGAQGQALGQFEYPFQIAVTSRGALVVSDVVNARLQVFSATGAPQRNIGAFGVELGQLYRPGGVAVDRDDNLWVADSVVGVVQVFRADGGLLDVLRDEKGAPLRFDGPLGLVFDAQDHLFVVESTAHRAVKVELTRAAGALPVLAPPRPRVLGGQQAMSCTICHLDWLPPFSEGRDSSLMARPVGRPDDPVVSRAEICVTCHNGAVGDSRLRVWDRHGHGTGILPPAGMTVPDNLPLIDGKLGCRTCHSAHGGGVPQSDIRRTVFLRVPSPASELCISCHADKTRGPQMGTHPTGGMPWPVPQPLIDAGAKVGPNPRELTCQVCHTPHGAQYDHLLVMGVSSNQLCVTCHDQMRPGMFRDGAPAEHPLQPVLNDEQRAAVRDMGTRIGAEDRLVCLSCHKLHHGYGTRFMLADSLAEGHLCLRCHSQRKTMVDSPHDLRVSAPAERNRLGLTADDSGPCGSCHLFHRYARQPAPGPGDSAGLCLTCHQPGACAQNKVVEDENHADVDCLACHNPHETRFGHFLAASPEEQCTSCHADQVALVGGPHDVHVRPAAWPASGDRPGDLCTSCHTPHNANSAALLRRAPAVGEAPGDGACVACHSEASASMTGALALHHPREGTIPGLAGTDGGSGERLEIRCNTCHDVHLGADSPKLLRASGAAEGLDLCTSCHVEMQPIVLTGHSPDSLRAYGLESAACAPCHKIHGPLQQLDERLLWPTQWLAPDPGIENHVLDQRCEACHRDGGPAHSPGATTHPRVPMYDIDSEAGRPTLPLYQGDAVDAMGFIACRTCHLPHGKPPPPALSPNEVPTAAGLQLRPFVAPNACTNCHGAEGLRRFLYFHDPARRSGATTQTIPAP